MVPLHQGLYRVQHILVNWLWCAVDNAEQRIHPTNVPAANSSAVPRHIKGPKYRGIPVVNVRGSWNQTAWSLQMAIYYTMKQDLETVRYKPLCHPGFKASCAVYPGGAWLFTLSLPLQSPFTWPSLQYPLFKLLQLFACKARDSTRFFYDMCSAWYMVLGPWVDLIRCFLNQSEHLPNPPFDWGKLVYSVANQNPGLMRRALSK